MRTMYQWIVFGFVATLGGCFFTHDYDPTAGLGMGGSGGTGGGNGGSSCTVTVCGAQSGNSTCSPASITPCATSQWARRYGNAAYPQEAHAVAINKANEVLIGGAYTTNIGEAILLDPDGPKELPGTDAKNGFLIKLDNAGTVKTFTKLTEPNVVGIAVDEKDNEIATITTDQVNSSLHYWSTFDSVVAKPAWSRVFKKMVARSVAIDGSKNIYVVGESYSEVPGDATFQSNEAGATEPCAAGLFVVSYDSNGGFRWAKPYQTGLEATDKDSIRGTAIAVGNGVVWVTGYFRSALYYGGTELAKGGKSKNMFVMQVGSADGVPTPGKPVDAYRGLMDLGDVEPASLTTDGNQVIVVGSVHGPNELDKDVQTNESAAFVVRIDDMATTLETTRVIHRVIRSDRVDQDKYGSRAVGITATNGRLYLAGTYSGNIKIDPFKDAVPSPGPDADHRYNTPFIARLDPQTLASLSFLAFYGGGEPFSNSTVKFAARGGASDQLALAGGWSATLDFAQGTGDDALTLPQLTPVAEPPTNDIFVAQFSVMP